MRSHYCGKVTESLIDAPVEVCGWVHRRRDHGGVIFVDLRDREGLVQVVFHPEHKATFAVAEKIRNEYVLKVTGEVKHRPQGTVNHELPTGHVEIIANDITILNAAETPPFQIDEYQDVGEDVRLHYRYIDLRRPEMNARIRFRAEVNNTIRHYLRKHDFIEIETPYLTKATPEGARDYLVPSRVNQGTFYALPQSPQIFKQLLMISGFDRYYQIVRCFRDEDLRADRQPEFTQLDMELSFVDEHTIQNLVEGLVRDMFAELLEVELPDSFPRMTYAEAIKRFGNDHPDLRIHLELVDVADLLKQVDFKVFATPANDPNGRVTALRLPGGAELSRKEIDGYTNFVGIYGAKGLAYIKVNDRSQGTAGLQSPILKFMPDDVIEAIMQRTEAADGDMIFFGAGDAMMVSESLGALRVKLGQIHGLMDHDAWRPLWVVDFPMFAPGDKAGSWEPLHHPFTAPTVEDPKALLADPGNSLSRSYDMVLNGIELGGGSIRIHDYELQKAVFKILGIDEQAAHDKFDHLLNGLRFGCPPHGGIAFGLDRLVMLMCKASSIREVIAFPKSQTAHCPLTGAPAPATPQQLRELGIGFSKKQNL